MSVHEWCKQGHHVSVLSATIYNMIIMRDFSWYLLLIRPVTKSSLNVPIVAA